MTTPLPTDAAERPVDPIPILLKEYDALRAEILARVQARATLLSVAAALAALPVTLGRDVEAVLLALIPAVGLAIYWRVSYGWIVRASERVADIEAQVNRLAGAELLVWETRLRRARR